MELQKWASDLNQKIYNDWKEQFSDWAAGFKVLCDEPGEADEEDLCGFSKAVDPRLGDPVPFSPVRTCRLSGGYAIHNADQKSKGLHV